MAHPLDDVVGRCLSEEEQEWTEKDKAVFIKGFQLVPPLKGIRFFNLESFLLFTERINSLADIRKQEPKAEEEKLSSQVKDLQDPLKAAAGHKEMLPQSEKELNPEDEKQVAGQDVLQPAAEQAASEEVEREQLLNYDAKQDLPPIKAGM